MREGNIMKIKLLDSYMTEGLITFRTKPKIKLWYLGIVPTNYS